MSFDQYETSIDQGSPVYLYKFTKGTSEWLYTDADQVAVWGGETYTPVPMTNNGFTYGGDSATDDLQIVISSLAPFLQIYIAAAPSDAVYLAIRKLHAGDTVNALVVWNGVVTGINRNTIESCTISGTTIANTLGGDGLRITYSRACPYKTYDPFTCKVNPATMAHTDIVSAVTGNSFTAVNATVHGDGWFDGGYMEWPVAGGMERKGIQTQVGNNIVLLGPSYPLVAGTSVTMYPGDDHTIATCTNKFNNLANYGGYPYLPGTSPFDGTPLSY